MLEHSTAQKCVREKEEKKRGKWVGKMPGEEGGGNQTKQDHKGSISLASAFLRPPAAMAPLESRGGVASHQATDVPEMVVSGRAGSHLLGSRSSAPALCCSWPCREGVQGGMGGSHRQPHQPWQCQGGAGKKDQCPR